MNKMLFLLLLGSGLVKASPHLKNDCLPESSLQFPISTFKSVGANQEMSTDRVIQHFKKVMGPIVKKQMGKELIVKLDWENPKVNASATFDDKDNPVLILFGGMARHPELSEDGLLGILCHELGHHLGGAPKKKRGRSDKLSWSSAEGQADYYTTSKCLPLVLKEPLKSFNFDSVAKENEVQKAMSLCEGQTTCARINLAGLSMARVFASLKYYREFPSLEVNDDFQAWETELGHPHPQCRLDTLRAGALCSVSPLIPFDIMDPSIGACYPNRPESEATNGERPRCWFRPTNL